MLFVCNVVHTIRGQCLLFVLNIGKYTMQVWCLLQISFLKLSEILFLGDFSVLCSYLAPRGERWMSGDFLAADRIIMWSDAGKGYLYKLPSK